MVLEIIGFLLLGLIAGVMSGMFGIGGGVVIVPMLSIFFAYDIHQASGTSLAALLPPVGILAVREYYRAALIKPALVLPLAGGIISGAWVGANLALSLDVETMQRLYGVFLLYIAWRFIEPRQWWVQRHPDYQPSSTQPAPPQTHWYIILLVGLIAGVLSGMFGIGGGVVIVSTLVTFFHFDMKMATGTSLAALLLPVSLPAVVEYYRAEELVILAAVLIAASLVFGALVGARIALGLPAQQIKRMYGVFLLIIVPRFLLAGLL